MPICDKEMSFCSGDEDLFPSRRRDQYFAEENKKLANIPVAQNSLTSDGHRKQGSTEHWSCSSELPFGRWY